MHRLLRRQLKKHLGVGEEIPAALKPFVAAGMPHMPISTAIGRCSNAPWS